MAPAALDGGETEPDFDRSLVPQELSSEETQAGESNPTRLRRAPHEPSAAERELQEATHEPYRTWCRACVAGRGRFEAHSSSNLEGTLMVIGVDYGFLKVRPRETGRGAVPEGQEGQGEAESFSEEDT